MLRPLGARLLSAATLLWMLLAASPAIAEESVVPKKYQLLYATLETQLNAFEARLPKVSGERALLRGAALESMRCSHPESLLSETRRENATRELDALRRAGAQAFWDSISYSRRRRIVLAVDGAKAAETRLRRIEKSVTDLRAGKA